MPEQEGITAIVLAGGKSRRMGSEKGLVSFRGRKLIDHVLEAARDITSRILIVSSNPDFRALGHPCVEDKLKNKGPLGGIYTGLTHSKTKKNLLLGCDMPFLTGKLLDTLVRRSGPEDVLLAQHGGKAEPLCSVYDRTCITHIRQLLEEDQLKITDALAGLNTRVVSFDGETWFRGNEFTNLNSPDELRKYDSST